MAQLHELVNQSGLISEINRICGSDNISYSNQAKIARLNASLDQYMDLAQNASRQWSFDDTGQTAPPLETQDIVSGTNRYKFASFTSEVWDLIKLEALNSAGDGIDLIPETFDSLGLSYAGEQSGVISGVIPNTFEELYIQAASGTPTHYIKFGDFVYLRPNPNYAKTAGLKAYFTRPITKFTFVTVTVTIASPGVFTATAHGLAANDTVIFETDGALPTGLTADTTIYYVISTGLTADDFRVSTTKGGSAVNTSGTQSGNHSFVKTSKSPGIPVIHHPYLARHASLPFLIENNLPQMPSVAQQIVAEELKITKFIASRGRDIKPNLSPMRQNNR